MHLSIFGHLWFTKNSKKWPIGKWSNPYIGRKVGPWNKRDYQQQQQQQHFTQKNWGKFFLRKMRNEVVFLSRVLSCLIGPIVAFLLCHGFWPQTAIRVCLALPRARQNLQPNGPSRRWGSEHKPSRVGRRIAVLLVSILTGLDLTKQENMFFCLYADTAESKPVKL